MLVVACPAPRPPGPVELTLPADGQTVMGVVVVEGTAAPRASVQLTLRSGERQLAASTVTAAADGRFTASLTYPVVDDELAPGAALELAATQTTTGGTSSPRTLSLMHACHGEPHRLELSDPSSPVAHFALGAAQGVRESSRFTRAGAPIPILVWKGLRYGRDTSGARRWKPPLAAGCLPGLFRADQEPSDCAMSHIAERNRCPPAGAEDCLFLNVYAPDPAVVPPPPSGKYPVMVWIHGGNFEWGYGFEPFAGHNLAAAGVVVVTINYRVGTMGFLAHTAFGGENDAGASGNYGLHDQVEALRWVKQNIDGFSGDPAQVTLFGQSAGGSSSCYHVASRQSAGLFHRAIIQSGGGCLTASASNAAQYAEAVLDRVKRIDGRDCRAAPEGVAACLRSASLCALAAINTGSYTPASGSAEAPGTYAGVDGLFLTERPLATFLRGAQNPVPVMIGIANREEYEIARGQTSPEPMDAAAYDAWCATNYKQFSSYVCGGYPLADYGSPMNAIELIFADQKYECRDRQVRRALSRTPGSAVFAYVFAQGATAARDFAAHGDELPFLFGQPERFGVTFEPADWSEALTIRAYWTQFAKTGDPNGGALPAWPRWDESTRRRQVLDNEEPGCLAHATQTACEAGGCVWTSLGCGRLASTFEGPFRDAVCDRVWDPRLPACGDGRLQVTEQCDDGNLSAGDGCDARCRCEVAPTLNDGVCSVCETAADSPADCGGDCFVNDGGCAANKRCDTRATCR